MAVSKGVRCLHLSDIHFYESPDGQEGSHRHSIPALKNIAVILETEKPDLLVVSGDVTNLGDRLSLDRAYQWLHDRIYVQGEYLGLRCRERGLQVLVVPGNHDAFNAPSHGAIYRRWQSALGNFYTSFPEYGDFWDQKARIGYRIIEKNGTRVFICFADSCYLGDPETAFLPHALNFSRMAKGKISEEQSESMMGLYDIGLQGGLKNQVGLSVAPTAFQRAIKILVMHHYLFEPSDSRAEPLLQLYDKRTVFQNLAMSDFDMLLCGHKHVAEARILSYLDNFDPRGKVRYAFNQLRRTLGIKALPLATVRGKKMSRMYRFVLQVLFLRFSSPAGLQDDEAEKIIEILDRTLAEPNSLRRELLRIVQDRSLRNYGLFDEEEIGALHSKIIARYSEAEWRHLVASARKLRGLVAKLGGRPFAHVVSGSSAKASETSARTRTVNVYDFEDQPHDKTFLVKLRRYSWESMAILPGLGAGGGFVDPLETEVKFPYGRLDSMTAV
jgi:predicted phosphodiesterase